MGLVSLSLALSDLAHGSLPTSSVRQTFGLHGSAGAEAAAGSVRRSETLEQQHVGTHTHVTGSCLPLTTKLESINN